MLFHCKWNSVAIVFGKIPFDLQPKRFSACDNVRNRARNNPSLALHDSTSSNTIHRFVFPRGNSQRHFDRFCGWSYCAINVGYLHGSEYCVLEFEAVVRVVDLYCTRQAARQCSSGQATQFQVRVDPNIWNRFANVLGWVGMHEFKRINGVGTAWWPRGCTRRNPDQHGRQDEEDHTSSHDVQWQFLVASRTNNNLTKLERSGTEGLIVRWAKSLRRV